VRAKPTIQLGSTAGVFTGLPMSGHPSSKSLSDLAKMATSKRPLADPKVGKAGKAVPTRAVFVVGSGLAAVLVLGVLSFELLRHSGEAEHHMPHAQALSTQVFSPSATLVASSDGGPAQLVPPPQAEQPPQNVPPDQPEAQAFDADTAPPDPPPPPVLEHPGPSEPPSAPTMGNTDLPPWALSQQQAWGTTSSDTPNQ
jgi:type IV secretory pathway VirB10-like protein